MENKTITAVLILDPSAAFDTVDHDLLLEIVDKNLESRTKPYTGMSNIPNQEDSEYA